MIEGIREWFGWTDGSQGGSATDRVYNSVATKNSPLYAQMEDLKKSKAEREGETPEQVWSETPVLVVSYSWLFAACNDPAGMGWHVNVFNNLGFLQLATTVMANTAVPQK
jgi:hypothetical protein